MITSSVKNYNGAPTLFVNNAPISGAAYITYYTHKAHYGDFAKAGYRLFSMPAYFAKQTINEVTQIPPFKEGIFDNGEPDFSVFDEDCKKIIAACPGAYIFPRVNVSPTFSWENDNPAELCDTGFTEHRRVSLASKKFTDDTKKLLTMLIEHIEASDYCEHIVGYQLAGGNTEEWFSFDQKGSVGEALRKRFEGKNEAEHFRQVSLAVCECICALAKHIKEAVGQRLVVGTFYGYTFECPLRTSGHHALFEMLNCPDVDFICSPLSYAQGRRTGVDTACMLPVDSLKKHGKLYFAENDTRTHLSGSPYPDIPYYNNNLWRGPERPVSDNILKMHFSRAICHGHAFWWFDMWGGWFTEYMDIMASFALIAGEANGKSKKSAAQVAVFVDERAYDYIPDESNTHKSVCSDSRVALGKAGTAFDAFLIDDFEAVAENYGAYVFLVPYETEIMQRAINASRKPYIIINEDNADITSAQIRDFYKKSGIRVYCDADAVVYESESYLFLHTCEEYAYPTPAFTEVFGERVTGEPGKSYLFRK